MACTKWTCKRKFSSVSAAKTLLQVIAGADQRIKLHHLRIDGTGINNTHAPGLVEIVVQTDGGTTTDGTSTDLAACDRSVSQTLRTSSRHTATAEPAGTVVVWSAQFHPQLGVSEVLTDFDITSASGGRFGVRVTMPNAVDVNVCLTGEE